MGGGVELWRLPPILDFIIDCRGGCGGTAEEPSVSDVSSSESRLLRIPVDFFPSTRDFKVLFRVGGSSSLSSSRRSIPPTLLPVLILGEQRSVFSVSGSESPMIGFRPLLGGDSSSNSMPFYYQIRIQ